MNSFRQLCYRNRKTFCQGLDVFDLNRHPVKRVDLLHWEILRKWFGFYESITLPRVEGNYLSRAKLTTHAHRNSSLINEEDDQMCLPADPLRDSNQHTRSLFPVVTRSVTELLMKREHPAVFWLRSTVNCQVAVAVSVNIAARRKNYSDLKFHSTNPHREKKRIYWPFNDTINCSRYLTSN